MSRVAGFILAAWAPLAARYALLDGRTAAVARTAASTSSLAA